MVVSFYLFRLASSKQRSHDWFNNRTNPRTPRTSRITINGLLASPLWDFGYLRLVVNRIAFYYPNHWTLPPPPPILTMTWYLLTMTTELYFVLPSLPPLRPITNRITTYGTPRTNERTAQSPQYLISHSTQSPTPHYTIHKTHKTYHITQNRNMNNVNVHLTFIDISCGWM